MMTDKDLTDDVLDEIIAEAKTPMEQYLALSLKAERAANRQQNSQQNIPENIPFEQWLSQQGERIEIDCGCVSVEVFMHWLRMAYVAGNSPVIPDGWVIVPAEPTAEMLQSGISAHYERNQIQIHDRPAPGPMECAYVAMLAAAPQQEVKNG